MTAMTIRERRPATIEVGSSQTSGAGLDSDQPTLSLSRTASVRSALRKVLVVAAVLLAAGVIAVNHETITAVRDRFIPKRWGVVEEGKIFRSGQLSAPLVKQVLQNHKIEVVVDLTFD